VAILVQADSARNETSWWAGQQAYRFPRALTGHGAGPRIEGSDLRLLVVR